MTMVSQHAGTKLSKTTSSGNCNMMTEMT